MLLFNRAMGIQPKRLVHYKCKYCTSTRSVKTSTSLTGDSNIDFQTIVQLKALIMCGFFQKQPK